MPKPLSSRLSSLLLACVWVSLSVGAMGCQTLARSSECQELEQTLHHSKPGLDAPLPANPTPEVLRDKARAYEAVSAALEKVKLKTKALDKPRHSLVKQLRSIAHQLEEAAEAVQTANRYGEASGEPEPGRSVARRNKHRAQVKRYLHAKSEIEAMGNKIQETMQGLTRACH